MTIPTPRNSLVSFHYFRTYDLDRLAGLRLIGDSGAFSAASQGVTITVKDLAGWARQWKHRLAWVASLDVIGDADGTRKNWHQMVDVHGIEAVPTIHFGADPKTMDYYVERGVDFLGLGGLVGIKAQKDKQLRWIVAMMRYARDHHPQVRFHGWGVTAPALLRAPFWSVDSSGWATGVIYGRLKVSDLRTGKDHTVRLNGKDVYRPEVAKILREQYGIKPSEIATSSGANRVEVVRACALTASVGEQRMRRMHGAITAPSWGARIVLDREPAPAPDGPHVHLVAGAHGSNTQVDFLADGPHQHLASTSEPNLEQLAEQAAPELHPNPKRLGRRGHVDGPHRKDTADVA
ncbi:Uncharacterised protein [Mycobacteroides abscessus subsp. abscessus]|nr:Uncharacterised protein [Mycobacteroides abscessus subsp. abscessus]